MHILFLTDNFPPEVNAPASRTFEHCREWVKAGHQVTVITCAPNFPKGKIYSGYKNRLWQHEKIAGIQVIRVWTYIAANKDFLKRSLDYLSFVPTAFLASLFVRKVDLVIGTSPQFFTVCVAYLTGMCKRVPWVFELRDIWPESIRVVSAMNQVNILNLLERLELYLYGKANLIVSVTHSFRERLMLRAVNVDKIKVITNGVDLSSFCPRVKDVNLLEFYDLKDKFVIGYIGTHGLAHALEVIIEAATLFKNTDDYYRFRFILIGDGAEKVGLKQQVELKGLSNIIFVESVPKDQIIRYWSILDVSIIHLKRNELFETVIPSKLFESMAMGIPVLHGVAGESTRIVIENDVGVCFEAENPNDLVSKIKNVATDKDLYQKLRSNGPKAALIYDRKILAEEMLKLLTTINNINKINN